MVEMSFIPLATLPFFEHYDAYRVGATMCKNNEANPKPTIDKLTMKSHVLHLFISNNVIPRASHKDEITHLDMYMMWTLLTGTNINLSYTIIRHMLSIFGDTTHRVALPYGALLTTIFKNFGVQLKDELQRVNLRKSDVLGTTTFKRMEYVFQNSVWIPKIGDAYDHDVDIDVDDILGEQGGDNAPTQEKEVPHGSSFQPLNGNFEEHFNMVNARLDTLVENFDAFKIN